MKRFLFSSLAGAVTFAAGAALADGPAPAPAQPVVPAPVVPVTMGGDWTGAYVGLSFGGLDADVAGSEETGTVYGLHAGYDYDFGQFVLGGELDYQQADDLSVAGADIDSVTRLKLRGGYDLGSTLLYATAGVAQIDTSIGEANGPVGGIGAEYKVTDNFSVGGELLAHRFEDIGSTTVDADANTLSLRGSFRF